MTILELPKDALLALTDTQLEQLIGRLAEAEVMLCGAQVSDVRFSGSITAPDGGVDVRTDVRVAPFVSGFIPKPNSIYQSKKHSMPAGAITKEMKPGGNLSAVIAGQCDLGGAYIIVSLADDCSEPMLNTRRKAMVEAIVNHPNKDAIYVDFYDRSKLHQWLRQHPGVQLWVRNVLSLPLSGWQPYGQWSNVPRGVTNDLILADGVSVVLPGYRHQPLTLEQAVSPTRKLIAASTKAIRITGLSGVGKTRFVEALFDEAIGENALDRTSVVYTDTGADPIPSVGQMIEQLMQSGRTATVVVDNCPSDLHSNLLNRIVGSKAEINLITVEYDIRDDQPLTTEVVHIEAHGPGIAEALTLRRYPSVGHVNARRIAEFSNGNPRIALALADRVELGESLGLLTDTNLFDRLFQQRNEPDGQLRGHAEVLSLAYSFSVEDAEGEADELAVLAVLCDATPDQLYRSAQTLLDRQVAQARGRWRAILPQAIANRLAETALDRIRISTLRAIFENPSSPRLLSSFAHRLNLLHNHPIAQQIVSAWLAPSGMLEPVISLDEERANILDYVAPVCPELLLSRIEADMKSSAFQGLEVHRNPRRTTIFNILISLAYEPETFDRCLDLLIKLAERADNADNYDGIADKIAQFFQPYLSGTHASIDQRAVILRASLWSQKSYIRALGFMMLSRTLSGPSWTGAGMGHFGARPRDYGFEPDHDQLVAWRKRFLNIAVEAGLDDDINLNDHARTVLAEEFRGLWSHTSVRSTLVDIAVRLNEQRPWTEGWKAVQSTIYFDYRRRAEDQETEPLPLELAELRDLLAPGDLIASIDTYVFGNDHDFWSLDPEFDHDDPAKYEQAQHRLADTVMSYGETFALEHRSISELGTALFANHHMPFGRAFGAGLARGSDEVMDSWSELVANLRESGITKFGTSVFAGFIEEVRRTKQGIDRQILDDCLDDPLLRKTIPMLHPSRGFNEGDLDRNLQALEYPDVDAWSFGRLLWHQDYAALPARKLLRLAEALLRKPNGDGVILDALNMKLHGMDRTVDTLGPELRRIGLAASIHLLSQDTERSTGNADYSMSKVLAASLSRAGNNAEKLALLYTLFTRVDAEYGHLNGYNKAIRVIVARMPELFLDHVFSAEGDQKTYRIHFLEQVDREQSILDTTDIKRIIAWCRTKDEPAIWEGVAKALELFTASGDDKIVSAASRQFLEACPEPDRVLRGYAGRIIPMSGSGSRAAIMEQNINALSMFSGHSTPAIAQAAIRMISEARVWVEVERERERRDDEAREQTFE